MSESQFDDFSGKVSLSKQNLLIHIVIHALAVGIAIAAAVSLVRDRISFGLAVALIFAAGSVLSYPTLVIIAEMGSTARPSFLKWFGTVAVLAVLIYLANRFLR